MIRRGFKAELRALLLLTACLSIAGYLTGHLLLYVLIAPCLYLGWTLFQALRFANWVLNARRNAPTDITFTGIWKEMALDVVLMHSRSEKEKLRLQNVVTRVQEMTNALTDGVILVNPHGNIEWWNPAAERIIGLRPTDQGQEITALVRHPRFVQYFEENDYTEPLTLADLRRQNQHLEFQFHVFGEGDRLLIIRDITRIFKLEQMRKDFVANASHELRTPLTVINGYLETLEDANDLPLPWKKAVNQMQQQTRRMTALASDLITLSNLETQDRDLHAETIFLAPLLGTIVEEAKSVSGERAHQFAVACSSDLALLGNPRELRSAFSNLIINAVNYSPANTTVKIECETDASGLLIHIRDQGLGIDPKHIPRITERFYRVDNSRSVASGGTGLGLAIVKHILLRHDAELRISSTLGEGSCFTCWFPKDSVSGER